MFKPHFLLCLGFLFAVLNSVYSQKQILYTQPATDLEGVFVNSDEVFQIHVTSTNTNAIELKAEIEGETFETVLLDAHVENRLWIINIKRAPGFQKIDDKLAAHKVLSVVLKIKMPQNKEFWVDSSLASVELTGVFKFINLNLSSGDCKLKAFRGSGTINTLRGDIEVETENNQIEAITRHGKLHVENNAYGSQHLNLKSVDGDIRVTQSE
ncbi:hypothetical protein DSM03_101813 [Leeuwenhoekiella aestuarii]|uniref:DUF4097 domain-containing protein n=1 Tax=Leeuwenhoekiella aestuarii TaxID=2249426 RepID=A0A4Q0NYY2_9FLAO|nr:DUF4097 family beta strand repeat-containing protein [Leeuwenhoekiella aestuarii]RXG18134.1 hypothetical protein DSM04_101322 [Leeuwenhoekiella aestuarii]RXG19439.1 hypothetical protein DSM03_101813 [Leeuwenhoekiella aestuarii]